MVDWLDLPQDLLETISGLLIISDPRISPDFIRMLSVCKSWQSILKYRLPRELPWLMMLPNNNSSNNKEEEEEEKENPPPDGDARLFYSPSNQKIHTISLPEIRGKRCCGSFQNGWLMIVDDKLDIFLFHPWSKKKIDLPHQSTFKRRNHVDLISSRDRHISKAAMSDDLKIVVIIYIYGYMCFWRMGDVVYTDITAAEVMEKMEDVIYHKGQFYALDHSGSVFLLQGFPSSARVEKLTVDLDEPLVRDPLYGYLVPDILTNSIFVITRDSMFIDEEAEEELPTHKSLHFEIFRVSLEDKRFTKVKSLGDRALFLGYNSSMIVMARQFPGCKGNHIYFADNIVEKYFDSRYGCSDLGVFSLQGGTVEQLFTDRFHPTWSPPLWISTPPYSSQIDFGAIP